MKIKPPNPTLRYSGRDFSPEEIDRIRQIIASEPELNRQRLSRRICDEFNWLKPDGGLKQMSCRVAMLRMHRDGIIKLPPPTRRDTNCCRKGPIFTPDSDPGFPINMSVGSFGKLQLRPVKTKRDSSLWNEFIQRYHYLGHKPLPGAQIRYFVLDESKTHLLAALGFGASAWKVAPRDKFIGWTHEQRKQKLHLIVNNARFLILPWVNSHNLASRILAVVVKQLPGDWQKRYNYQPVLLETFVQKDRFKGTCYRAANWIHLGQTQGRGKLDQYNKYSLPIKDIFVYPLNKSFRRDLCAS